MPLSKAPPPTPLKATHVAEVQKAADDFGNRVKRAIDAWVHLIAFPRVRWLLGTGVSAVPGYIVETASGTMVPARTGSGITATTSQVAGKAWWLVEAHDGGQPAPMLRYFNHGPRVRTAANNLPLPVQAVAPAVPGLDQAPKPDEYAEYIRKWGDAGAQLLWYYLRSELKRLFVDIGTFWAWGTVESVDVPGKAAMVVVEASNADLGGQQVLCGWGTKKDWTSASLGGKRVRIGMNAEAVWVDDLDVGSGRIRNG